MRWMNYWIRKSRKYFFITWRLRVSAGALFSCFRPSKNRLAPSLVRSVKDQKCCQRIERLMPPMVIAPGWFTLNEHRSPWEWTSCNAMHNVAAQVRQCIGHICAQALNFERFLKNYVARQTACIARFWISIAIVDLWTFVAARHWANNRRQSTTIIIIIIGLHKRNPAQ